MEIDFYIDPDTGLPHIAGRGIEGWEAIDVLLRPEADYNGQDGTRHAVGQTRNGRYLRVIYRRIASDGSRLVITAFDLPPKAKQALRRHRRRRK